MKIKIELEIDTEDTAYCPEKWGHLNACLQNLSHWLDKSPYFLEKKCDILCRTDDSPEMKAALLEHANDDLKLSSQIFDRLSYSGTFKGKRWEFRRNDKGYFVMFVNGVETTLPNVE